MDMNHTFKIGTPNIPGLLEIANDGSGDGHCQFTGVGATLFNHFVDIIFKRGMRCSLSSEFYDETNSTHSDVIDAVQYGDYDWLTEAISYGSIAGDDIVTTPIVNEDIMTILSYYEMSTKRRQRTVLSMFTSVPWPIWIGYILSFFVFVSVTYFASFVMKSSKYCSLWNTICAFLDQDNYTADSLFMSTLSAVVSVAMFFLLSYATNSMGTDLVTIDDPIVIRSYDDVIDRGIINGMMPITSEWDSFARAEEGSKEWKIFQNTESQFRSRNDSNSLPENYYSQKQVSMGKPAQVLLIGYALIMAPANKFDTIKGRLLLSVDADAKSFSKVWIYSSKWKGTFIEDAFNKFLRKTAEHGLWVQFFDVVPLMMIDMLFEEFNTPSNRRLMSKTVEKTNGEGASIGWNHFKPVLINLIIGFALPLIFLVYEFARNIVDSQVCRKYVKPQHVRHVKPGVAHPMKLKL